MRRSTLFAFREQLFMIAGFKWVPETVHHLLLSVLHSALCPPPFHHHQLAEKQLKVLLFYTILMEKNPNA